MSSNLTLMHENPNTNNTEEEVVQAGIVPTDEAEKPYQVPISPEAINAMLIGIYLYQLKPRIIYLFTSFSRSYCYFCNWHNYRYYLSQRCGWY